MTKAGNYKISRKYYLTRRTYMNERIEDSMFTPEPQTMISDRVVLILFNQLMVIQILCVC